MVLDSGRGNAAERLFRPQPVCHVPNPSKGPPGETGEREPAQAPRRLRRDNHQSDYREQQRPEELRAERKADREPERHELHP